MVLLLTFSRYIHSITFHRHFPAPASVRMGFEERISTQHLSRDSLNGIRIYRGATSFATTKERKNHIHTPAGRKMKERELKKNRSEEEM